MASNHTDPTLPNVADLLETLEGYAPHSDGRRFMIDCATNIAEKSLQLRRSRDTAEPELRPSTSNMPPGSLFYTLPPARTNLYTIDNQCEGAMKLKLPEGANTHTAWTTKAQAAARSKERLDSAQRLQPTTINLLETARQYDATRAKALELDNSPPTPKPSSSLTIGPECTRTAVHSRSPTSFGEASRKRRLPSPVAISGASPISENQPASPDRAHSKRQFQTVSPLRQSSLSKRIGQRSQKLQDEASPVYFQNPQRGLSGHNSSQYMAQPQDDKHSVTDTEEDLSLAMAFNPLEDYVNSGQPAHQRETALKFGRPSKTVSFAEPLITKTREDFVYSGFTLSPQELDLDHIGSPMYSMGDALVEGDEVNDMGHEPHYEDTFTSESYHGGSPSFSQEAVDYQKPEEEVEVERFEHEFHALSMDEPQPAPHDDEPPFPRESPSVEDQTRDNNEDNPALDVPSIEEPEDRSQFLPTSEETESPAAASETKKAKGKQRKKKGRRGAPAKWASGKRPFTELPLMIFVPNVDFVLSNDIDKGEYKPIDELPKVTESSLRSVFDKFCDLNDDHHDAWARMSDPKCHGTHTKRDDRCIASTIISKSKGTMKFTGQDNRYSCDACSRFETRPCARMEEHELGGTNMTVVVFYPRPKPSMRDDGLPPSWTDIEFWL